MRFRYCISIVFFALASYSNAQDEIRFNHLNLDDGLPNNIVNCMLQDSSGHLWFGTGGGLSRYDGNSLVTFVHNESDSTSICNSRINCLYEDNLHNVWIGTFFGLSKFDPVKKNFKNYYFNKHSLKVGSNIISHITQDNKGILWVATDAGIYNANASNPKFSLVKTFSEDHYGYLIHGMAFTSTGRMFILMDTALVYSDDNCSSFKTVVNNKINDGAFFSELNCDKTEKHLWFGAYKHAIAYEFDPQKNEIKKYSLDSTNSAFPIYFAYDFCRLNDSIMMVGCILGKTGGGLVFLNAKRNTYHTYVHLKEDATSLSDGDVWYILKDRQNSIWIGCDLGINSFNLRQLNFHWLTTYDWGIPDIGGISIRQMCYDNNLWIGTIGGGLFEYNPPNHHFSRYSRPFSKANKSPQDQIFSMCPYKDTLWLGTGQGFISFDISTHKFDTARKPNPELKELYFDTPKGIDRDNTGTFWFGTYAKGVFSYNPATGKGAHYLDRDTNLITKHSNIMRCLCVDAAGNKWVGTYEDGFYCMNAVTNQLTWNIPGDKNAVIMQRGWINDIYCDRLGNTYIATQLDGLIIYDENTNTFRTVKNPKWTDDNKIRRIVEVGKGILWLATGKGLSCWNLNNNTFSNYPEGMQLAGMVNVAGCASPDGTVYFGGGNKMLYFNPDDLKETAPNIHPEITSLSIMNKEYLSDITKPVFLGYKDNYVSFTFSAFDFLNEKGDQFAYYLEGLDNDWNYCGNMHYASYTNLSGGNYILHLKVQNAAGEWVEARHPLYLHIATPYWKTWWFFTLCGLAIFALGYLFYYLKMQRKLEAEKLRKRLARDLHDDIGSSLSSIFMISKMAVKNTSGTKEETQVILNKISESSHKTMESMNDIVWIVNPENDLMDSILTRMHIYFSEMLETSGIKYSFIVAEDVGKIKLGMEERRNFYLIFKEAINNLAKYSRCTEVIVTIVKEENKIKMEIKDNGIGFNLDNLSEKGNGLKNMRERARIIKGSLVIESKVGHGTTIRLILPLP